MRTGIANLPLHYGSAPSWLFERMTRLSREITSVIVEEYGTREFLRRLSDPFWFQSFGCVLGFDWHSSGLTTTVCGALKQGLRGLEKDLGIFVGGGKGKTSRKTPQEIEEFGERFSLSGIPGLIYASKMSAKVDNTALQDGFQLYHHNFIFTSDGSWAVIQQGMNSFSRTARRYHWLSHDVQDFVQEPHSAVCCDQKVRPLNLVAQQSRETRKVSTELVRDEIKTLLKDLKILNMPQQHPIKGDLFSVTSIKRLERVLYQAHERNPQNFEELLGIKGVGPATIRALALVSELIYGAKPSFEDPVRYSFSHGGKDGYPYSVNKARYDQSIEFLRNAISKAKIGQREKLESLKRLYV